MCVAFPFGCSKAQMRRDSLNRATNESPYCEQCKDGYFLQEGLCALCPVRCAKCVNGERCVTCKPGLSISNDCYCGEK